MMRFMKGLIRTFPPVIRLHLSGTLFVLSTLMGPFFEPMATCAMTYLFMKVLFWHFSQKGQ